MNECQRAQPPHVRQSVTDFITFQFHFVLCGFGAKWCKERERWEESVGLGQSRAGCLEQDQILKVSTKAHGTNLSQLQSSCSGGGAC